MSTEEKRGHFKYRLDGPYIPVIESGVDTFKVKYRPPNSFTEAVSDYEWGVVRTMRADRVRHEHTGYTVITYKHKEYTLVCNPRYIGWATKTDFKLLAILATTPEEYRLYKVGKGLYENPFALILLNKKYIDLPQFKKLKKAFAEFAKKEIRKVEEIDDLEEACFVKAVPPNSSIEEQKAYEKEIFTTINKLLDG